MNNQYPLALSSWGKEELAAIDRVIKSDMFSMGPEVAAFENEFAHFVGSKYAVMVNSGSSANLVAIGALFFSKKYQLSRGDEVIVPAVSWITTYTPLQQYGLKIKFVDIDKETLNFDLTALKSAISDKTKAIFAVNLLGNPNEFDQIKKMIAGKNILLIEDNCESLGAKFEGKHAGTFGVMGTYSTFFSHHMSTMEGGLVTTDDLELYHILLSLRSHGWTRHLPKNNELTGIKSDNEFEESFKFILPGYNLRPVEMSGAIGREQLKKLPEFIRIRRENAAFFIELFKNHPYLSIVKEIGESSWFGFAFILKHSNTNRDDLVQYLMNNKVDCRPIVAGNITKNQVIKYFNYEIHGKLFNADLIDQFGFFVGNHHVNMKEAIQYLKDLLDRFFEK